VNKSIESLSGSFNCSVLSFSEDLVLGSIGVQDEFKSILVIRNLGRETAQIEVVLDVIFVYFTEKFVAFHVAKPAYPRTHLQTLEEAKEWSLGSEVDYFPQKCQRKGARGLSAMDMIS